MVTDLTPITAVAAAMATKQPEAIEAAVRAAYASGVTHGDLLAAVEVGRRAGAVPDLVVTQAYLTVYSWSGPAAQSMAPQRVLAA
jgi:hypothetical protein